MKKFILSIGLLIAYCVMGDRISELEERIAYLESINCVGYNLRHCYPITDRL